VQDTPEPELQVDVRRERGVAVVAVGGELDAATVPLLQGPLSETLAGGADVVLDLSDCGFLDSTGLHAIIEARAEAERRGVRLAICCIPAGPVVRVIEEALPGMNELHDSREAALAALGA
jgi:anti-anti-sigma factor